MKLRAVGRFAEEILRAPFSVSRIILVNLNARINDDDDAEACDAQIA